MDDEPPTTHDGDAGPPVTGPQARVLAALRARDHAMLDAALALAAADRDGDPGAVPTAALLAVDASLGRRERGRLRTVARHLRHLPATFMACRTGAIGFDVLARACQAAATNRLTVAHCHLLDTTITTLLADRDGRWDADDLVAEVRDHAVALRPDTQQRSEAAATRAEQVWTHPDLFGGGEITVTAGAEHFATVLAAIDATVAANGLLDRTALRVADDDTCSGETAAVARHNATTIAAARAAGLVALCRARLAGTPADGPAREPVPSLRLSVTLDGLLGITDQPARVLTTLAGGRLRTTAATARRLVDAHGAFVQATVVDHDGTVLGTGRRTRQPPGWLSRLVRDLQPRCVIPGCSTTVTDIDHALRWTDGGRTDLDNLAAVCRRHHLASGWTATTRPTTTGPPPTPVRDAPAARRSPQPARPGRTRPRDPDRTSTRPRPPPVPY